MCGSTRCPLKWTHHTPMEFPGVAHWMLIMSLKKGVKFTSTECCQFLWAIVDMYLIWFTLVLRLEAYLLTCTCTCMCPSLLDLIGVGN